ncbi:MAG: hypothetical protein GC191_20310 [Azospirillum sp.]|nr:hypothetical protein [Azospirillum sp.]
MSNRRLDNTEVKALEIGSGGWGIGDLMPGATTSAPAGEVRLRAARDRAPASSITAFNAAKLCGLGRSRASMSLRSFAGRRPVGAGPEGAP